MSDLISHLLAKSAADRPATAEEVAEALQKLESSLGSTNNQIATPILTPDDPWLDLDTSEQGTLADSSGTTSRETRKVKPRTAWSRGPILIIGAAVGVVAAAVLVGVLASSRRPPAPQPDPEQPVTKGTPPASPKPAVVKKAFAWPVEALREGRIPQVDLGAAKLLKIDEFDDLASGWPQGKPEDKGGVAQQGYKEGIYYIHKDFDGGVFRVESAKFGELSTFMCQVEGRVVDDPAANWELWLSNEQLRKAIAVKLNGAGKIAVAIAEKDSDEQEPLFSGTHAAIRKGNEFNKLAVIYTADRLEVYVNGVAVCDPLSVPVRLQPVNIALGVSGGGKSTTEFRHLSVWSAEGMLTPEERLKNHEVPVKDSFRLPFA